MQNRCYSAHVKDSIICWHGFVKIFLKGVIRFACGPTIKKKLGESIYNYAKAKFITCTSPCFTCLKAKQDLIVWKILERFPLNKCTYTYIWESYTGGCLWKWTQNALHIPWILRSNHILYVHMSESRNVAVIFQVFCCCCCCFFLKTKKWI